jgi:predicted NUDIX family phosphoesterase
LQDEPRKPGENARKDPINGTPEEADTFKKHLDYINVIQQNAVIITGQEVKRGQARLDKWNSERWL